MLEFCENYAENVRRMDSVFRVEESFDMLRKVMQIGEDEITLYYIDGFVKDATLTKIFIYLYGLKGLGKEQGSAAPSFLTGNMPYVEAEVSTDGEYVTRALLSGSAILLGSTFGARVLVIDARSYPARSTAEPEGDQVMKGARDGFVETLIFNTALIRRRIRDPALTMRYVSIGSCSRTDVCVAYMQDRADLGYVEKLVKHLRKVMTDALPLGEESLLESLVRRQWYNPFPKVRTTERPDTAASQLLEGSVLVLCDTSPQVMILPTCFFDFLQETNDYYFPVLTGNYIRAVRRIVFWLTLFLIPLWYLALLHPETVPPALSFILPEETGKIPILAQLFLVELIIDGLRMASLNTPTMLTNSLSVVSGLILGDFAVGVGWLIPEVILYMAFVAIANFTQRSYELGYAVKFFRMGLLLLVAVADTEGFIIGCAGIFLLLLTCRTADGQRRYLYPLFPFDGKALCALLFRKKKPAGRKTRAEKSRT